jgi:SEC-C motif/Glycosyl transferase family 2
MSIAAVTMTYNESVFLPIWTNHYGSALGADNLFVIDDGSTDGSASDNRGYNYLRKERGIFDEDDRALMVSEFHRQLLTVYDTVIFTDVDELIVVDPKLGLSLREYLGNGNFDHKTPVGFNVLHDVRGERPISFDRPLFAQRHYVQFSVAYCKPLISKVPMNWGAGFHFTRGSPSKYDDSLFLFHLRAMDWEVARSRFRTLSGLAWSKNSVSKSHGKHFRLGEQEYMRLFFSTTDAAFASARTDFDRIGESLNDPGIYDNPPEILVRVPRRFEDAVVLRQPSSADDQGPAWSGPPAKLDRQQVAEMFAKSVATMMANPNRNRNELCPCGSGKRFKHCHGALT